MIEKTREYTYVLSQLSMFAEDTTRHKRFYPENYVYNPFSYVLLHISDNIPQVVFPIKVFSAYTNVDSQCFVAKILVHTLSVRL